MNNKLNVKLVCQNTGLELGKKFRVYVPGRAFTLKQIKEVLVVLAASGSNFNGANEAEQNKASY